MFPKKPPSMTIFTPRLMRTIEIRAASWYDVDEVIANELSKLRSSH